jgi:hypothetical protein
MMAWCGMDRRRDGGYRRSYRRGHDMRRWNRQEDA